MHECRPSLASRDSFSLNMKCFIFAAIATPQLHRNNATSATSDCHIAPSYFDEALGGLLSLPNFSPLHSLKKKFRLKIEVFMGPLFPLSEIVM